MHTMKPIQFTLVVDDFGINFIGKEKVQFLINTLNEYNTSSVAWGVTKYFGLMLALDCNAEEMSLSMPGCVVKALK